MFSKLRIHSSSNCPKYVRQTNIRPVKNQTGSHSCVLHNAQAVYSLTVLIDLDGILELLALRGGEQEVDVVLEGGRSPWGAVSG